MEDGRRRRDEMSHKRRTSERKLGEKNWLKRVRVRIWECRGVQRRFKGDLET